MRELETAVPRRVSMPPTPIPGLAVARMIWMLPPLGWVMLLPDGTRGSVDMLLKSVKSCSPPVMTPPFIVNAPVTKYGLESVLPS